MNTNQNQTYSKKLEQVRKYCVTQNIPLDSERAKKYAVSQGVNHEDLLVETRGVQLDPSKAKATATAYARTQGLDANDPQVRKYMNAGSVNERVELIDIEGITNLRAKEAILHYAQSQGRDLNDSAVQKYARGLIGERGDFSPERQEEMESEESTEQRIQKLVARYAESQNLPVEHERVQKYERGLRGQNSPIKGAAKLAAQANG